MKDVISLVNGLKRPKLLVRASKFGADDYNRTYHLNRILNRNNTPKSGEAILQLLDIEDMCNTAREDKDPAYRLIQHVDVLIALIGETRLLTAQRRAAQSV